MPTSTTELWAEARSCVPARRRSVASCQRAAGFEARCGDGFHRHGFVVVGRVARVFNQMIVTLSESSRVQRLAAAGTDYETIIADLMDLMDV